MPDIVKKYLDKIKEFWNKYNKKQNNIYLFRIGGSYCDCNTWIRSGTATDGCGAVLFNGFRGYGGQTIAHQQ